MTQATCGACAARRLDQTTTDAAFLAALAVVVVGGIPRELEALCPDHRAMFGRAVAGAIRAREAP